ncbi:MAG TPA: alpha/beta hydrolase [Vicinamibacterales bacterium]|nr:alpha/beta hydrolase [Vicinamibacterales bacterium]
MSISNIGLGLLALVLSVPSALFAQSPADLQRLAVLEDRSKPSGRKIELAYALLKSTAATPGSPIVYLDGGPGGSGVGLYRVEEYRRLFDAMRAAGDVILLSQRGTGFSTPRLTCAGKAHAPADLFVSAKRMIDALTPRVVACGDELRGKGIDLDAYNTEASADDLEDLRKAIGAPKISLFGFSYGTHLALTMVRRHPASIDRVILAGTEGPDHTQKLPHTFDLQLARLAFFESPTSDLVEVTHAVMATLDRSPVQAGGLTIGKEGFQYLLRRDIGDTNDTANLIKMIRDAAKRDYGMLGKLAARRHAELNGGMAIMPFAMDCASGVTSERLARINRELPTSALGVMTNFPFPFVCDALQITTLPDAFRAPIVSTLPVLFISGTLDSNTPPYQAEEVRWGFPNSTHLVIENAGHESTLPRPDVQRAIVDFLKSSR